MLYLHYLLILILTFKENIALNCYYCLNCKEGNKQTRKCPPRRKSCAAILMTGTSFYGKKYITVDRNCVSGNFLYNHTQLPEENWNLWVKSYCETMSFGFYKVEVCKERHCETNFCNKWTESELVEYIPTTESGRDKDGDTTIDGPINKNKQLNLIIHYLLLLFFFCGLLLL